MGINVNIVELENKRLVWRASESQSQNADVYSSGFASLDEQLEGGFAASGVFEINSLIGIGELRLCLPYLRLRQQQEKRLLVFIAPPEPPNAEMLAEWGLSLDAVLIIKTNNEKEALWATEQCLKSGCCYSLLLWQNALDVTQVRRLQLAAQKGSCALFVFRQQAIQSTGLPLSLSLALAPESDGIRVTVNKRKGGWPKAPFSVAMNQYWPELKLNKPKQNILAFPKRQAS